MAHVLYRSLILFYISEISLGGQKCHKVPQRLIKQVLAFPTKFSIFIQQDNFSFQNYIFQKTVRLGVLGVCRSLNMIVIACIDRFYDLFPSGGGGGGEVGLPYKSHGDAHRKIQTKEDQCGCGSSLT